MATARESSTIRSLPAPPAAPMPTVEELDREAAATDLYLDELVYDRALRLLSRVSAPSLREFLA